ncbi:unnamed protein product [Chrysoparadoxa australica]
MVAALTSAFGAEPGTVELDTEWPLGVTRRTMGEDVASHSRRLQDSMSDAGTSFRINLLGVNAEAYEEASDRIEAFDVNQGLDQLVAASSARPGGLAMKEMVFHMLGSTAIEAVGQDLINEQSVGDLSEQSVELEVSDSAITLMIIAILVLVCGWWCFMLGGYCVYRHYSKDKVKIAAEEQTQAQQKGNVELPSVFATAVIEAGPGVATALVDEAWQEKQNDNIYSQQAAKGCPDMSPVASRHSTPRPDLLHHPSGNSVLPFEEERDEEEQKVQLSARSALSEGGLPDPIIPSRLAHGTISACHLDGTYGIHFDNGSIALAIPARWLQLQDAPARQQDAPARQTPRDGTALRIGSRVQAMLESHPLPGSITAANPDGSFAVQLDSGAFHPHVAPHLMTYAGGGELPGVPFSVGGGVLLEGGSAVSKAFCPGTVLSVSREGMYEVRFDDGVSVAGVAGEHLRGINHAVKPRGPVGYAVGDRVGALRKSRLLPGSVTAANPDGATYAVQFDSGAFAPRVAGSSMRHAGMMPLLGGLFRSGDRVQVEEGFAGQCLAGTIRKVHSSGTVDVDIDNGCSQLQVRTRQLRRIGGTSLPPMSPSSTFSDGNSEAYAVGERVELLHSSDYIPGTVRKVWQQKRGAGTYEIDLDDGSVLVNIPAQNMRGIGRSSELGEGHRTAFDIGDRVEARLLPVYMMGTVSQVNADGTFDVDFENGVTEYGLTVQMMRADGGASPVPQSVVLGQRVEAIFRGTSKWLPGVIAREVGDGSYDIDYDDGTSEIGVPGFNIRKVGDPEFIPALCDRVFKEGCRVEAKHQGARHYYAGVIAPGWTRSPAGTFDVDFDNGASQRGIPGHLVRVLGGRRGSGPNAMELVGPGTRVEAQYSASGTVFPGRISSKAKDGTYGVDFDMGASEEGIPGHLIWPIGKKSEKSVMHDFNIGDRVEAGYHDTYASGVITSVNGNGTYDIRFEQGETERAAPADKVKPLGPGACPGRISVGDRVEAPIKRSRYQPAEVKYADGDSTYTIEFDAGGKQAGVSWKVLRPAGGTMSPVVNGKRMYKEFDKVTAPFNPALLRMPSLRPAPVSTQASRISSFGESKYDSDEDGVALPPFSPTREGEEEKGYKEEKGPAFWDVSKQGQWARSIG